MSISGNVSQMLATSGEHRRQRERIQTGMGVVLAETDGQFGATETGR